MQVFVKLLSKFLTPRLPSELMLFCRLYGPIWSSSVEWHCLVVWFIDFPFFVSGGECFSFKVESVQTKHRGGLSLLAVAHSFFSWSLMMLISIAYRCFDVLETLDSIKWNKDDMHWFLRLVVTLESIGPGWCCRSWHCESKLKFEENGRCCKNICKRVDPPPHIFH